MDFTIDCSKDGRTKQCHAQDCNINTIIKRAIRAGGLPICERRKLFADVSSVGDFMSAQEIILKSNNQFMSLPSDLRARFGNDPINFLAFCSDANNRDEMIKLGLIDEKMITKEVVNNENNNVVKNNNEDNNNPPSSK